MKMECKSCRWWESGTHTGKCNRYPCTKAKDGDEWCAEFVKASRLVLRLRKFKEREITKKE